MAPSWKAVPDLLQEPAWPLSAIAICCANCSKQLSRRCIAEGLVGGLILPQDDPGGR